MNLAFAIVAFLSSFVTIDAHKAQNPLNVDAGKVHHHKPQQHVPNSQHHSSGSANTMHQHRTMDKNIVQDQEHIMEHLDGKINKPLEEMSAEELQFHYFKVHDYNDDDLLDGLELIWALTHHGDEAKTEEKRKILEDSELAQMVDGIMKVNDANGDGFVDYAEFLRAQRSGPRDNL